MAQRHDWEAPVSTGLAGSLALGAVIGPILFALTWLILGFVSPGYTLFGERIAPYSAISQPISGLGLGSTGPYMNAAFVLSGVLLMVGILAALKVTSMGNRPRVRWVAAALLALSPLGSVVAGVFTLEVMLPHLIGFLLGVATPVLGFLVTGLYFRGMPAWRRLGNSLLIASPLTLVLVVLFFLSFDPMSAGDGVGIGGITQRALGLEVHAWFVAIGWRAFRLRHEPASASRSVPTRLAGSHVGSAAKG